MMMRVRVMKIKVKKMRQYPKQKKLREKIKQKLLRKLMMRIRVKK